MKINVLKFGGSSVSNIENFKIVANKIIKIKNTGVDVVVVVSAPGKRTDELIEQVKILNEKSQKKRNSLKKCKEDYKFLSKNDVNILNNNNCKNIINVKLNKREVDSLLTIGEQESASKLSILLNQMRYNAISLNGMQAGIFTNSDFGKAKIIDINTKRIIQELKRGKIVIVTGFQGVDKNLNLTTLGRGGSDTSAVALAIKLNAEKCYIFSDVDGIYKADPNDIENAEKLKHISYSEMENASSEGARVLCERSVSLADKYNMEIIAKSTFNDNEGTIISSTNERIKQTKKYASKIKTKINSEMDLISNFKHLKLTMEDYELKMCVKNDKIFKAEIGKLGSKKLDKIISGINRKNIKIKNLTIKNNSIIIILNDYFKEDIKSLFEELNIEARFSKVSELSLIGTGISNNAKVIKMLFKAIKRNKLDLTKDLLTFEMHANVISVFFNKKIDSAIIRNLISNCDLY